MFHTWVVCSISTGLPSGRTSQTKSTQPCYRGGHPVRGAHDVCGVGGGRRRCIRDGRRKRNRRRTCWKRRQPLPPSPHLHLPCHRLLLLPSCPIIIATISKVRRPRPSFPRSPLRFVSWERGELCIICINHGDMQYFRKWLGGAPILNVTLFPSRIVFVRVVGMRCGYACLHISHEEICIRSTLLHNI